MTEILKVQNYSNNDYKTLLQVKQMLGYKILLSFFFSLFFFIHLFIYLKKMLMALYLNSNGSYLPVYCYLYTPYVDPEGFAQIN